MQRSRSQELIQWLNSPQRKPLVIRGARQVGKTWLVRELAQVARKNLVELNFERNPQWASLFTSNDPKSILLNIEVALGQPIDPKTCILFLDEIQQAPAVFAKLRWFAEDLPQLPVVVAGSLLEFLLTESSFSMPVGRISFMHLEPLSFEEFLLATGNQVQLDYVMDFNLQNEIPNVVHEQMLSLFREFSFIGGMPAAVFSWVSNRSVVEVHRIHQDLLATYRSDFSKYSGRVPLDKLEKVMISVPAFLGEKFVYSKVNPHWQAASLRQVLDLLEKARICHPVKSTAGNGIPLGAEVREKFFKEIFLDVGLACSLLGLSLNQLTLERNHSLVNQGGIAEQVTGQLLRLLFPSYVEPSLYYWQREEKGSNAEIDYLIQHENQVIPVEVKAGTTGTLKSLHLFMGLKNCTLSVRIHSGTPSRTQVKAVNSQGNNVEYELLSLPFYMLGQLNRLLEKCFS